ncbi:MAG: HAD family phosphatase [Planctomycetota bacterium]|nr:HAD family phosphatase [Planctomycetota bacterium]
MGFPYRAVLFDFDGVLANTEPLHLKAYREALAIRGLTISDSEFYGQYVHYDDAGFFKAIFADRGAPLSEAGLKYMVRRKSEAFRRNLERADMLFPGVREAVEALYAQAVLGVVSMAARVEIEAILTAHGIRNLFSVIVSADDVERKKPDPEPYLIGLELINRERPARNRIPPDRCMAVEDSAGGVRSAVAAGMYTVGITNTISAEELRAAGASRVISNLRELLDAAS